MVKHVEKRLAEIQGTAPPRADPNVAYCVTLSVAQWDLVVLALGYVHARAFQPAEDTKPQPIDLFGRRLIRRRLNECLREIKSTVPDVGDAKLDQQ